MSSRNVSRKRRRQKKDEEKYDEHEDVYEEMVHKKTVFERWFNEETGFEEIVWEKIVRGRKRATRALRGSGRAEMDADSGDSDSCSDTTTTEAFEDDDAPGEEIKPRRTGCHSMNLKQIPPHANDVTGARPGNHLHKSAPPNLETTRTRTRQDARGLLLLAVLQQRVLMNAHIHRAVRVHVQKLNLSARTSAGAGTSASVGRLAAQRAVTRAVIKADLVGMYETLI